MKGYIILLILSFLPTLIFSEMSVALRPGLSFYNDTAGYFVRADADFLQPLKNLNISAGFSLNGASFHSTGIMNAVLFASLSYAYPMKKLISLPIKIEGALDLGPVFGALNGVSQSSVSQIGLSFSPSLSVTYALTKSFDLGLFFSYHIMIYQELSSFIGLGISGRFYFHPN